MPKIVDHDACRLELRRAARDVFARRGLAGTGLAHVAKAAGMGRASIYHYYPSKDALVDDLARELLEEESLLFARAGESAGGPLARIASVAAAVTAIYEAWGHEGAIILEFWARDLGRMREVLAAIRSEIAAIVIEGQRCGEIDGELDADDTAAMIVALIDGLLLQYFVDPAAFPRGEPLAARIRTMVGRMLAR